MIISLKYTAIWEKTMSVLDIDMMLAMLEAMDKIEILDDDMSLILLCCRLLQWQAMMEKIQ